MSKFMNGENIAFCSATEIKNLSGILKFLCVLFIKNKESVQKVLGGLF